jgi:hypothetical protein
VWVGESIGRPSPLRLASASSALTTVAHHPVSTYETQPPSSKSARELLDERPASGEIDTDEYQQRRRALEGPLTHVEAQR